MYALNLGAGPQRAERLASPALRRRPAAVRADDFDTGRIATAYQSLWDRYFAIVNGSSAGGMYFATAAEAQAAIGQLQQIEAEVNALIPSAQASVDAAAAGGQLMWDTVFVADYSATAAATLQNLLDLQARIGVSLDELEQDLPNLPKGRRLERRSGGPVSDFGLDALEAQMNALTEELAGIGAMTPTDLASAMALLERAETIEAQLYEIYDEATAIDSTINDAMVEADDAVRAEMEAAIEAAVAESDARFAAVISRADALSTAAYEAHHESEVAGTLAETVANFEDDAGA